MVAYYLGWSEAEVEAMGMPEFSRMLAFIERERRGKDEVVNTGGSPRRLQSRNRFRL